MRRHGGPLALALVVAVLAGACGSMSSPAATGTTAPNATTSRSSRVPGTARGPGGIDEQSDDTVSDDGTGSTIAPTASELAQAGTSLPIVLKPFPNGYQKPTVLVSVGGGAPVPVLLDTGSTGLHLLASAAGTTGVTTTATTVTETYSDHTQYTGSLATAPVTIGGVASTAPIDLMLIATVACVAGDTCPTSSATQLVSQIGIYGTMGVSPAPSSNCAAPIYSPLLQLPGGATGFSVTFGAGGSRIVLGNQPPAPGGVAVPIQASAYTPPSGSGCGTSGSSPQYPNGSGVWDPGTASLCWSVAGAAPVCGNTTFDTGAEDIGLAIASFPGAPNANGVITSGTPVVLTAPGSSATLWSISAGTVPGVDRVTTSSPAPSLIATTGGAFYPSGWVTYDTDAGRLVITPAG